MNNIAVNFDTGKIDYGDMSDEQMYRKLMENIDKWNQSIKPGGINEGQYALPAYVKGMDVGQIWQDNYNKYLQDQEAKRATQVLTPNYYEQSNYTPQTQTKYDYSGVNAGADYGPGDLVGQYTPTSAPPVPPQQSTSSPTTREENFLGMLGLGGIGLGATGLGSYLYNKLNIPTVNPSMQGLVLSSTPIVEPTITPTGGTPMEGIVGKRYPADSKILEALMKNKALAPFWKSAGAVAPVMQALEVAEEPGETINEKINNWLIKQGYLEDVNG